MRHLISTICVLGVLSAPFPALAAEKEDLRDARCIAALAVMATQKKMKKNDEWILTAGVLYALGRLEGRGQDGNLKALTAEALAGEDEATLIARVPSCLEGIESGMSKIMAAIPE